MKALQILVLIFGLSIFANAQKTVLSGTVYAPNGAVIPLASIKLKNKNGKEFSTKTDDIGNYKINVLTGFYLIEIKSVGFNAFVLKNYLVSVSDKGKMIFDVTLNWSKNTVIDTEFF